MTAPIPKKQVEPPHGFTGKAWSFRQVAGPYRALEALELTIVEDIVTVTKSLTSSPEMAEVISRHLETNLNNALVRYLERGCKW